MAKHVPPSYLAEAFHCPRCGTFAHQRWYQDCVMHGQGGSLARIDELSASLCHHCKETTVWVDDRILHPAASTAPSPTDDMPTELAADYHEAADIVDRSPRGAAALLRLVVQKLMVELGEKGKNINDDIASLVKKGLRVELQEALDVLRVVGNSAVHPGKLDLKDDRDTALRLFEVINLIVETLITQPKRVKELYAKLPASAHDAIRKRDS